MLPPVPVRLPDPRGRQPLRLRPAGIAGSLYGQNPLAADLVLGAHGPRQTVVTNPVDGTVMNRYEVRWIVENVSDPRPGKVLNARRVRRPSLRCNRADREYMQPGINKILNIATVY